MITVQAIPGGPVVMGSRSRGNDVERLRSLPHAGQQLRLPDGAEAVGLLAVLIEHPGALERRHRAHQAMRFGDLALNLLGGGRLPLVLPLYVLRRGGASLGRLIHGGGRRMLFLNGLAARARRRHAGRLAVHRRGRRMLRPARLRRRARRGAALVGLVHRDGRRMLSHAGRGGAGSWARSCVMGREYLRHVIDFARALTRPRRMHGKREERAAAEDQCRDFHEPYSTLFAAAGGRMTMPSQLPVTIGRSPDFLECGAIAATQDRYSAACKAAMSAPLKRPACRHDATSAPAMPAPCRMTRSARSRTPPAA